MSVAASLPTEEALERRALEALQGERLAQLLARLQGRNAFYTRKLEAAGVRAGSLSFPRDLRKLPFTTKAELVADQAANPPWGTALTEPIDQYTRYCQTSSTTGRPLKWIDTNERSRPAFQVVATDGGITWTRPGAMSLVHPDGSRVRTGAPPV